MSGWVSVKDRLPELTRTVADSRLGDHVLCYCPSPEEYSIDCIGEGSDGALLWCYEGIEASTSTITHWKPLPAPPVSVKLHNTTTGEWHIFFADEKGVIFIPAGTWEAPGFIPDGLTLQGVAPSPPDQPSQSLQEP